MQSLTVLGLESSCDETAAAVVRGWLDQHAEILSNVVLGQNDLHEMFGGVVPEIAARAHAERADLVISQALAKAAVEVGDLDAIAVTAGPGLIGGVMAGVMTARGFAAGVGLPLIGVNHLEGHALTARLTDDLAYPFLLLLASGGHCQFLQVRGYADYRRIGGTIDDSPGEAFDKVAKMLGLGFPGGPLVERRALEGDPARFKFPRPLLDRPTIDMSFSGLKTAVRRARDKLVEEQGGLYQRDVADICAAFQSAIADVISQKARRAMRDSAGTTTRLAVAGGVAANKTLRHYLERASAEEGFTLTAPPLDLCTDNGAMIAWAGLEKMANKALNDEPVVPRPRWPLDSSAPSMLGSGKKGAKA